MPRVVPSQVVNLIDQLFPEARTQKEGGKEILLSGSHATQVAGILELIEQISPELINLSAEQFMEYTVSVAGMRETLERWRSLGSHGLSRIPGLRHLSPITIIRQALDNCPNEFPAPSTAELSFITDIDLRENLRLDISAVNRALSNGEWKAATVLAGSAIEALLLWSLQQRSPADVISAVSNLQAAKALRGKPSANLEEWTLPTLIEVATELKVIKEDTAIQVRLGKNYRNLIHPGRVRRLGQACDRGTALAAVAGLERVVADLSP